MEDSSWYFTAAIVDSKENIAKVSIHNAPDHLNSSQGDLAISRNWMEYIEFKKCGHYPWLEKAAAKEFYEQLRDWLLTQTDRLASLKLRITN